MWLAGWAVVIAELAAIGWLVWLYSQGYIAITFEKGADLATLVLTAAIVVLTGVAVALGVITIWGFREIRDHAVREAVKEAIKAAVPAAVKAVSSRVREAFDTGESSPTSSDADQIATAQDDDHGA
jgi:hypothetical protein